MRAFSLVELSIVLVILGLLVGGILAGQSLIRAAELRSVTAQFVQYQTAIYSFRDKYLGLPGDFRNATSFWQSAGGTGDDTTCLNAQSTASRATCNGNSDGKIMSNSAADHVERFLAWKHLANAGLIEGNYSGKTLGALGGYTHSIGANVPAARIGNGFFDISNEAPTAIHFSGSTLNRNSINIYGDNATNGILLPEEAWNIDMKLDDGSPVTGRVFTTVKSAPWGTDCASSDANDATYDLAVKSRNCILRYAL